MDDHQLVRPGIVRWLCVVLAVLLALAVLADLFVEHHAAFGVEGTIGFGAWYGFLGCIVLVLFARALGAILKRPDSCYDR